MGIFQSLSLIIYFDVLGLQWIFYVCQSLVGANPNSIVGVDDDLIDRIAFQSILVI